MLHVQELKAKNLNTFCHSHLCRSFVQCLLSEYKTHMKENKTKSLVALLKSQIVLTFRRKVIVKTAWCWWWIEFCNCGCGSQGVTENESGGELILWRTWRADALYSPGEWKFDFSGRCVALWKICVGQDESYSLGALLAPFYGSFQWLFFSWATGVFIVAVWQEFSLCEQGKKEIFHHVLWFYVPFKIKRFN